MKINKNRVYDVLHKSVVSGLIAFTAIGTVYLGYKAVHWYTGESESLVL
jgi:Cytochrome oxidase c assembly